MGLERFATLGRFSAQMAHDLKNPLAAAKGAAEYLTEELRRAGDGANQEFAQLVVDQLDRLARGDRPLPAPLEARAAAQASSTPTSW